MHLTGFSQNARTRVVDFYQSIDREGRLLHTIKLL